MVHWGNNHTVLASAVKLTHIWASLIQPTGSAEMLLLPQHPRLAGRSSAVLLSMCTMLATLTLLLWWLAFLVQWLELRAWLDARLKQAEGRDGLAAGSSSSNTVIGGVPVPTERLVSLQSSKAAELLLKPAPGIAGIIMLSLLHLSLLSLLCNVALLAAHGVVYWLMPALLNDAEFDAFYPLAPSVR
eukprot:jgi/Sobl393_1/5937/SZX75502.1